MGGGEGLHFEYVQSVFAKYVLSDIRISKLCPNAENARESGKLEFFMQDAEKLTLQDSTVDRTIFMCVLHHLNNPEKALREAKRVTKLGGMISIYLPCDPGLIYRMLRKIFTRKIAKELGIDYELMNAREHINHYYQLNRLIKHVFKNEHFRARHFPIQIGSHDFNIYSVYHITLKSK